MNWTILRVPNNYLSWQHLDATRAVRRGASAGSGYDHCHTTISLCLHLQLLAFTGVVCKRYISEDYNRERRRKLDERPMLTC